MSDEDFSDSELPSEYIESIYDALQEEPMYIAEISRKLNIGVSIVSRVIGYLSDERGQISYEEVEPSYEMSSPLPPIKDDRNGTRETWANYKVCFGSGVDGTQIDKKMRVCERISSFGETIARESERAMEEAIDRFDVSHIKTDFNDEKPDVRVNTRGGRPEAPDYGFEVSVRTSNPVGKRYVKNKRKKLFADADLIIIAPRITESVFDKYPQDADYSVTVYLHTYPSTYPVFTDYQFSGDFIEYLDEVKRPYTAMEYYEYVDGLEAIIDAYLR